MYKLTLLLLLSFAYHTADAVAPKGGIPWRTMEVDEAPKHDKPMLVYFGAEWCPPCRMLEAKIFNQPDVQAAMKALDAVFVDGDGTDAEALMARFKVLGFPTILAIAPDGQEVGRFAGSVKKNDFIQFLSDSSGTTIPMAMLQRLARGKSLSASEWGALSAVPVLDAGYLPDGEDDEKSGTADLQQLREWMAKADAAIDDVNPPLPSLIANRIHIKALLLDAVSKHPGDTARQAKALDRVLGNSESLADLTNELANYSKDILDYLHPNDTSSKRARARKFIEMMEAESTRFSTNAPLQIQMMQRQLPLLELGSDNADAARRKFQERVELLLKQTTVPAERLALVPSAAYLLSSMGREFRAEALIRETLKNHPDALFLHDVLSYYAYYRGDMDQSVQHAEMRFRGSLDNPRAVRWGVEWINLLIEQDPAASATIENAANEVADFATKSDQVFLGFNAKSMTEFATSVGRWAASAHGDAAVKSRLLARLGALCAGVQEDPAQAKACKGTIETLNHPPAEGQPDTEEEA